MTEEPQQKNDKTLINLINSASSMIESITGAGTDKAAAPAPAAPAVEVPPVRKSIAQRALEKQQVDARWEERNGFLEEAALQLLFDLRGKGLIASGETISIKLETDSSHQYVTLRAEIEKSLQR